MIKLYSGQAFGLWCKVSLALSPKMSSLPRVSQPCVLMFCANKHLLTDVNRVVSLLAHLSERLLQRNTSPWLLAQQHRGRSTAFEGQCAFSIRCTLAATVCWAVQHVTRRGDGAEIGQVLLQQPILWSSHQNPQCGTWAVLWTKFHCVK